MNNTGQLIVPIFQTAHESTRDTDTALCKRKQFPLTAVYASTIPKAQSMTVDQAVLDISQKDFTASLTYVAISRLRTLSGILFNVAFNFQTFRSTGG